ncbi:MAG: SO2930 family diheme c-type cytochrome [Hyphomonadaceae bacterium]
MRFAFALVALALLLVSGAVAQSRVRPVNLQALLADRPAQTLAEYRLFRDAAARVPNEGVTPYDLNTALYADGAHKFRLVFTPPGTRAAYNAEGVFEFPVGTVLIKSFAVPADMRRPNENIRYLETRLLIRRADGWVAYPYVWNAEQTEARYSPIGAEVPAQWTDEGGEGVSLTWRVPNRNQCAGCHEQSGALAPLGPAARNLNRDYPYTDGAQNQLAYWAAHGHLDRAPADAPRAPNAYDPTDGTFDQRARAYLDVNCAHCHNPRGPAHTSGLDLRSANADPHSYGILKRPVAAGRASGGFEFSIEPGHPERSILVHRMDSTDPGVMMPELGRQLVDRRAVALMREWIAQMDAAGRPRTP